MKITDIVYLSVLLLVFSAATGGMITILFGIYCRIVASSGNARHLYVLLRGTACGYLFPLIFMILYAIRWNQLGYANTFVMPSKLLRIISLIAGIIWAGGAIIHIIRQIRFQNRLRKLQKSCLPAPSGYYSILEQVKEELHISKEIRLMCGYGVRSPFIYGAVRPGIYLPVRKFKKEHLEVILFHELIHYKQKDNLIWKPLFGIIFLLFWFNPLVWYQWRLVERWAEASNDARCCSEKMEAWEYFSLIKEMSRRSSYKNVLGMMSMWHEEKSMLLWRLRCMTEMEHKKASMPVTLALVAVSIVVGSVFTQISLEGMHRWHFSTYWRVVQTQDRVDENQEELLEEQRGYLEGFEENKRVLSEQKTEFNRTGNSYMINWTIPDGQIFVSEKFKLQVGEIVAIMPVSIPANRIEMIGIVDSKGNAKYLKGKDVFTHEFVVEDTGEYRFFVDNHSGAEVLVSGGYIVYNIN